MTGQRWHIIGFHTTVSLWPSSLNRKRPRRHAIRKKHKMPHCKAHLVLFFYSDILLSNGERIS